MKINVEVSVAGKEIEVIPMEFEQPKSFSHPVHSVYDGVFNSYTNRKINLIEPTLDMIDIDDIAQSLSNICRFGGHVHTNYNVAQHSVIVAALAPMELKKEALLHDAAEAYVGDVIKPWKVILEPIFEPVESRFMQAISEKYRLDPLKLLQVKKYDKQALEIEHAYLQKGNIAPFYDMMRELSLLPDHCLVWSHAVSKHTFLSFYHRYFSQD